MRMSLFMSEANPNFEIGVTLKNPEKQPRDCPFPLFSLPNKLRTWGNLMVIADCDGKKHHLPVFVSAKGHVLVAKQNLPRGEMLSETNTVLKIMDVSKLSSIPLTDLKQIGEAQTLRLIPSETVLTIPMLKRAWMVKASDEVQISYTGEGFSVISSGKAINNGYLGDKVRIRLENKTIVEAIIIAPGKASMN